MEQNQTTVTATVLNLETLLLKLGASIQCGHVVTILIILELNFWESTLKENCINAIKKVASACGVTESTIQNQITRVCKTDKAANQEYYNIEDFSHAFLEHFLFRDTELGTVLYNNFANEKHSTLDDSVLELNEAILEVILETRLSLLARLEILCTAAKLPVPKSLNEITY